MINGNACFADFNKNWGISPPKALLILLKEQFGAWAKLLNLRAKQ